MMNASIDDSVRQIKDVEVTVTSSGIVKNSSSNSQIRLEMYLTIYC